jgi:hypothetical protein
MASSSSVETVETVLTCKTTDGLSMPLFACTSKSFLTFDAVRAI